MYIDFQYNQDRSFFHSFELEECYGGLLFEDESDASHFLKRVQHKEKHASKATLNNKAAIALKKAPTAPSAPGPRGDPSGSRRRIHLDMGPVYYDDLPPEEWRPLYAELASQGITEEMIAENREFIKDYIKQQGGPLVGLEPPIPRKASAPRVRSSTITSTVSVASVGSGGSESHNSIRRNKAPPPPPPPAGAPSSPAPSASNMNRRSLPPAAASAPPVPPPAPPIGGSQEDSPSPSPPPFPSKESSGSETSLPASSGLSNSHKVPPTMRFIGSHVPRPGAAA